MSYFDNIFTEVAAILVLAAAMGALTLWLRQPLIIAFILVGVLVGPVGLDWVHAVDQIDLFAQLGIALLLFVVGLKLNPRLIRAVGPVALVAGLGQIALTAGLGYLIARGLGVEPLAAFYVAAALTFSSTIIIIKLLSDKHEIDALHGRIALGILIIQDIVVVVLMLGLSAWGGKGQEVYFWQEMIKVISKGGAFLLLVVLATRYLLPPLLRFLVRLPELVVLFAIAWAIGLAALAVELGVSKEVGAFVAGISLASTPYRAMLATRLISTRDFLLLFFFIDLGVHIDVASLGAAVVPALLLSLFVLIGKPLMVMALVGGMKYTRHTSTMAGLAMGQISEFSLVLAALGMSLGHIDEQAMGLITLVGLITIGFSSYMIINSHHLYEWLASRLRIFERKVHHPEEDLGEVDATDAARVDVIVFGLRRFGGNIAWELHRRGLNVLGVDFDPDLLQFWHGEGMLTLYGDVEDPEFFHDLPVGHARWVVSTIENRDKNLALINTVRGHGFNGRIAVAAHTLKEREFFIQSGVDLVLLPFRNAATETADILTGSN